jgi:hypothetical protein
MSRLRLTGSALVVLVVAIVAPVAAGAQTCAGFTAIDSTHRGLAGGGLTFTPSTTGYGASVVAGANAVVGGVTIGGVHDDEFDVTGLFWSALIAGQVAVDTNKKASICPGVQVSRLSVNDLQGSGIDVTRLTVSGGVSVGVIATSTPTVDVVPTLSLQFGRARATVTGVGSISDTVGIVSAGVGLILKQRFTIQPSVSRPFGVDGPETSFAINATVRFGG